MQTEVSQVMVAFEWKTLKEFHLAEPNHLFVLARILVQIFHRVREVSQHLDFRGDKSLLIQTYFQQLVFFNIVVDFWQNYSG